MRLIDADALKNLPFERMIHTDFGDTAIPIEEIDNAPTINLAVPINIKNLTAEEKEALVKGFTRNELTTFELYDERPQGEWIFRQGVTCGGYYKCNKCGEVERAEKNYCPNCGADMRGEKKNADTSGLKRTTTD